MECMKQRARDWQIRLQIEMKHDQSKKKFITLTFSNESVKDLAKEIKGKNDYELDNGIATITMHRFRERYRKQTGKSPRHWFITELGHNGTENIHLHGILWTELKRAEIEKIWQYGYICPIS